LGYKAGLDGALAHPDVPVFPPAEVARLGLCLPFRVVEDSHPGAVSLWGADRDAVRRVCLDMVGAIPEHRLGHLGRRPVWAAGKLAGRELRLADVVPDHPGSAWALFPERHAWGVPAKRWAQRHAAVARCKQDAGRSAV
jgi:hypothetical protein